MMIMFMSLLWFRNVAKIFHIDYGFELRSLCLGLFLLFERYLGFPTYAHAGDECMWEKDTKINWELNYA